MSWVRCYGRLNPPRKLEAHPPLSLSAEFHRSFPPMQVYKDQVVTEENPGKAFIDIAAEP